MRYSLDRPCYFGRRRAADRSGRRLTHRNSVARLGCTSPPGRTQDREHLSEICDRLGSKPIRGAAETGQLARWRPGHPRLSSLQIGSSTVVAQSTFFRRTFAFQGFPQVIDSIGAGRAVRSITDARSVLSGGHFEALPGGEEGGVEVPGARQGPPSPSTDQQSSVRSLADTLPLNHGPNTLG